MDDISSNIDSEELMDLEEPETYDLDDEEEEIPEDSVTSPFPQASSEPASAATSTASSPVTTDDFSPPFNFTGKPVTIKRGRGRPRREGGKPPTKRGGGSNGAPRVRRAKSFGLSRCRGSRGARYLDRMDFDPPYTSPSSLDDFSLMDGDGFFFPERERSLISPLDELPYAPETWAGKVCAFCNLNERSQLGQGEMMRLNCPDGFTPQRISNEPNSNASSQFSEKDSEDKSPRGPVTCRRTKNFSKSRTIITTNEYIDEFTLIGYNEQPSVNTLFEENGHFYVHRSCALWSDGVIKTENQALEQVGPVVLKSSSRKCTFCNRYGASLECKSAGCTKVFHFPCATASGAFQDSKSLTAFCASHLGEAAMCSEAAICNTCKHVGDIANLMFCSVCGIHYHGSCVGLAQLPGVRAGWQCRKCRLCQICRIMGDETKLMACEQCDKVYHASCQRPIVTSIPKYGWKCKCCRVCGDCGSRTPGAGLSSRWHLHYTVCDSCYQQRNKGCCCPVCQRAYRSHAHREMVQCTMCRKFVHGTCDPEADVGTHQQKRDSNPDYEYVCIICKNISVQQMHLAGRQLIGKKSAIDDSGDLSASQESLYDDMSEFESIPTEDSFKYMGLGKGKPFASKIAKKKLSFPTGKPGRPKGYPGKQNFMKRHRLVEFGKKRGPKAKMRGMFGVPGVGLSRPVSDGKNDEEPGVENRLVLCSAKDKFVLTQDICVMCGAIGTDQEGCLIACIQCGQCYHPYCVNVKVTKIILQKGWRCLDCTVCEGCGQKNDESRLILCDDCDVSYHTYCMDPPLDYVPHGNWKCKWCACCRTCGASDPGFNCTWMNGCTECGPCASHICCPSCGEPYSEGDLIIQCVQCERWLHGLCDLIKTEQDAEKCAVDGYTCLLCRPRDVPPPHLIPAPTVIKPSTPTKSPEIRANTNFFVDGVCLNESGHNLIKSLSLEYQGTRKKRKKVPTVLDKEAGIMATIESVVAGGSAGENCMEDTKIEMMDIKDEPQEIYKEGMMWTKEDGPPPDGFTLFTMENGICVLRRKRQRNLQKLGIGGFLVRIRGSRTGQENDDIDSLSGQTSSTGVDLSMPSQNSMDIDKPKKKPIRRKLKCKLAETFPTYLQEAFFGKDLMDLTNFNKDMESGSSDEDKGSSKSQAIELSAHELESAESSLPESVSEHNSSKDTNAILRHKKDKTSLVKVEEEDDSAEDLKDVLALPGDLLDTDLVNSIINEEDDDLSKNAELEPIVDEGEFSRSLDSSENSKDAKDELSDILGSHFALDSIPNINSKDVEDIFKGVLTDESQESQLSQELPTVQSTSTALFGNNTALSSSGSIPQMPLSSASGRTTILPGVQHVSFPPSPYHSEFSSSPQFSPAFSEPPSPWLNINDGVDLDNSNIGVPSTYNQRSSEKMKADERLGVGATISAVLYSNMNHPEWKTEYPNWTDRYRHMLKKWRTLTQDQKAPYLQQARDNRSQLRMKKQQQSQNNKDTSTASSSTTVIPPIAASSVSSPACQGQSAQMQARPPMAKASEDQEKITQQQKSVREAEQERQWKQLQAMRQHQAQQQQHVIHEQRVQAIARVQRTITEPASPFPQSNQPSPLSHNTAPLEVSPSVSPSASCKTITNLKSPSFTNSPQTTNIRTPTPSQSPVHELQPQSQRSPSADTINNEGYCIESPATQKSLFFAKGSNPVGNETFAQQNKPMSPFASLGSSVQMRSDQPELTSQVKDIREAQQLKNIDTGKVKATPTVVSTNDAHESDSSTIVMGADSTFRQPLPPASARPRIPLSLGIRPPNMKMPETKLQGNDPRLRLIIQQRLAHSGQQLQDNQNSSKFPTVSSSHPSTVDQYEQNSLRRTQTVVRNAASHISPPHLSLIQNDNSIIPKLGQAAQVSSQERTSMVRNQDLSNNDQEIPDNVTAELEKLEQETGTMAELQGVSEILGGLGDDDDELLAEMGADFNILEYADPELEALAGEKTNILDIDLEDDNLKQERRKEALQQRQRASAQPTSTTAPANSASHISEGEVKQDSTCLNTTRIMNPEIPAEREKVQSSQSEIQDDKISSQQSHKPSPASTSDPDAASIQATPSLIPTTTRPQPIEANASLNRSSPQQHPTFTAQQIHQQMLHQVGCQMSKYVQQEAAQGRPMPPGSKLRTPDGIVGIVLANNNVQLQIPPNFQQRLLLQLQNQKLQMRLGKTNCREQSPQSVSALVRPRAPVSTRPQPPPPYPGPPPPYPGNIIPQQRASHQEQPLLLEELLEQEKREQEKQHQNQSKIGTGEMKSESSLLSDHDFDQLRVDVLNSGNVEGICKQGTSENTDQRHHLPNKISTANCQPTAELTTRIQMFNANLLPAPPLPPENILTEQDKQVQANYEQWLNHQNNVLTQQLKYYETEVQKLRKGRKSLNSKQRQLRKSGNQLNETDTNELQRISAEQAILQKHLESSRKQCRQHGMLMQEYRNKQQMAKPALGVSTAQIASPHGQTISSPVHHSVTSQSPLLSPQQSPLTQHLSPMSSPSPIIAHSPGHGSVAALLQSPGGNVSPMQSSPRIGTPLSHGEGSPGPVPSPSQICLPPPVPRMTSPQHRRVVTSPIGYSADIRGNTNQIRFVRPPTDCGFQQRTRNQAPSAIHRTGTTSPLNSPPLSQISLVQQQLLQKQLQQQVFPHQHQLQNMDVIQDDSTNAMHSPRLSQLIQQRGVNRHQQLMQPQTLMSQQQQQMLVQQQQIPKQQQQQIAMQLQSRLNQQLQQPNPPQSPIPPKSPLHSQQIMSPHSMPSSPMAPKSPMVSFSSGQLNMPNSPVSHNSYHKNTGTSQPPSSPMMLHSQKPSSPIIQSPHAIRRTPTNLNVDNSTHRTSFMENQKEFMQTGGGNPNNPNNAIPLPQLFGTSGFFKLGLRGGAPMWSGFGRGEKRVPTPPVSSPSTYESDKQSTSEALAIKQKKESHINKVSILKKKGPLPKNCQKAYNISADYVEYNEGTSNSPSTPPLSSSHKFHAITKQELSGEKHIQVTEIVDYEDDNSTILSSEVSLSSAAQQNDDEMEMTETLSQNDIGEVLSSPMEADRISDDFLLFQENMVVDISGGVHYSDKEEAEEEYANIVIRSPTTSDDEFIMQGRTKKYNLLNITETSGSPEHDANTDPSTEPEDDDITQSFEESEVVIINQPVKTPEEQISTKEDFEELIDEGSRKDKLKYDIKTTADMHKLSSNVYSFSPKTQAKAEQTNIMSKMPQKISLIAATPLIQKFTTHSDHIKHSEPQQLILTPSSKINTTNSGSKLTSIILTHNSMRGNILNVGQKIRPVSPGITIVSASTSQIASILPSKFTVPVISASAVRQLPNVKVIDKPSPLSLATTDASLQTKKNDDDLPTSDAFKMDEKKNKIPFGKHKLDTSNLKIPILTNSGLISSSVDHSKQSSSKERKDQIEVLDVPQSIIQSNVINRMSKEKPQHASTKTLQPVVIRHSTPELKMTAQIIQETSTHMQINSTEATNTFDEANEDKSVVISIPSPTPSQEQMLDNIALQALENRRREFDSFEDVLDMIENMQNTDTALVEERQETKKITSSSDESKTKVLNVPKPTKTQADINISNDSKHSIPQLSPLSQPTELTTNMANVSQQLRSLLSSIHTVSNSRTSNVETLGKLSNQKVTNMSFATSPIVSSRIIQNTVPSSSSNVSTVIVPNKQVVPALTPNKTTIATSTTVLNIVTNKTITSLHSEEVKMSQSLQVSQNNVTSSSVAQKSSIVSNSDSESTKKTSLTLTAMLQNQPAATYTTKSSPDTITAASLLATPVSLSLSNFSSALAQAQPNAIIAATASACTSNTSTPGTSSSVITSPFKGTTSSTNLLHMQLTKSNAKPLSLDSANDQSKFEESMDSVSSEMETDIPTSIKQEAGGCKYSSISTTIHGSKCDDSQNVLLKKLLQNTACASTHSSPPGTTSTTTILAPSVESQKPNPPTLSSLLPPVIKTEPQSSNTTQPRAVLQKSTLRETSFVSSPIIQQTPSSTTSTQQLHIDVRKCAPPIRSSSRDELLSPSTPRSSCSQDSNLQTPPLIIKKEMSNLMGSISEVKRELLDENSEHSEISDLGKSDTQIKEELESQESSVDKLVMDKEELKKQKRRMYNQKRRQNQILNKESSKPNKRPRKNSKLDEDYDSYIDNILVQIRHLPPMTVSEPVLARNYGVMPIFGSGDLSKIGTKWFDSRSGELTGTYGNATIPGLPNFYDTKPYGDEEPLSEKPPVSTQRGFYDQEFSLIRFDSEDDKKFDLFSRDDSPDSILSSSSPECSQMCEASDKYLGLKLISEDEEEETGRVSPEIFIIKPIPVRVKPAGLFLKDYDDPIYDKENMYKNIKQDKLKPECNPPKPVKESENIKVTLTLTSSAAEDIVGVLRDLANILQIAPPTTYQIIDNTSTSTEQNLGMYRTKGKDGKEGAPIDIQSILNGAAKFCKHCDVVILDNMIRKKVSDLPFMSKDIELMSEGEELFFCSSACYMQFALMHRSPSLSEDRAAAIIDHLSQKNKYEPKSLKSIDNTNHSMNYSNRMPLETMEIKREDSIVSNFAQYPHTDFKQFGSQKSFEPLKSYRNIRYKHWIHGCLQPNQKGKILSDKEITEMLYQMGITVTPPKVPEDTRSCMFCHVIGDGVADGPARLLNFDVDKWVHLNCALWSDGVYETVNGALMNLENALQLSFTTACVHCGNFGATIRCFKTRCSNVYHLSCAVRENSVFFKNKTVYCNTHVPKNEKDNELTTLSVSRRVYVNRDENRQVASVMHHSDTNNLLRVGSLIFLNVGQILPHQLQNFHNPNYIYPIGYKIIRFYWSMRYLNKRCRYICSIHDCCGRPEFKVLVQENSEEDVEFSDQTCKGAWTPVLEKIAALRRENKCLQMFPKFISGEDLFGLTEPAIVRVLESLPGIDTLSDYKFKYGRNPLLELPLAINPTGAARTEPRLRIQTHWKRPHTQRTTGSSARPLFGSSSTSSSITMTFGEIICPYSKQFVHSKSSQYKKMKQEWRNNVYLARSKIQGLGLYAAKDLEKHTMVIEYIGEVIRTELSECREKQYEAKNRGIYMFRLDDDRVVDATLSGGLARYINHSCNPNCVAETVEIDRDLKIIIFSKRRIQRGEELAYDYKFDIEDDQNKISCMCGAPNCRKWMN